MHQLPSFRPEAAHPGQTKKAHGMLFAGEYTRESQSSTVIRTTTVGFDISGARLLQAEEDYESEDDEASGIAAGEAEDEGAVEVEVM